MWWEILRMGIISKRQDGTEADWIVDNFPVR